MPLVQPFDFNPLVVDVKTGAYSIPAANYAYVIPDSEVTIDGAKIVDDNSPLTLADTTASLGTSATEDVFTNNTSFHFEMKAMCSTPGGASDVILQSNAINFIHFDELSTNYTPLLLGPGDIVRVRNKFGGAQTVDYLLTLQPVVNFKNNGFWVPGGTTLNGERYIVTEYLVIT